MSDASLPGEIREFFGTACACLHWPVDSARKWPLRYAVAIAVVAVTVALRMGLAPLLGTQAPLLPFVLAVFVSAYLGGRGAGLLASVLTPVAATFWFTAWPHDAPPMQWGAHVLFFLLIADWPPL